MVFESFLKRLRLDDTRRIAQPGELKLTQFLGDEWVLKDGKLTAKVVGKSEGVVTYQNLKKEQRLDDLRQAVTDFRNSEVKVGFMPVTKKELDAVTELNNGVWNDNLGGTREMHEAKLEHNPKGQFGAFVKIRGKDTLVGVLHTHKIFLPTAEEVGEEDVTPAQIEKLTKELPQEYDKATGHQTFSNHDPKGNTRICSSVAAHKMFRYLVRGLGSKLIQHGINTGFDSGDKLIVAYSRPVGFGKSGETLESYNYDRDRVIGWHITKDAFKQGARRGGPLVDARPQDSLSGGLCMPVFYTKKRNKEFREGKARL